MNDLIALLAQLAPHHWLILGLVLLIAEMVTGTTYLLWPAVAAFATALIAWIAPVDWVAELVLFAVLVVALTWLGRPLVQRWRHEGAASGLNERASALIGARGVVTEFANGVGSVRVQDTVWRAVSDAPLGVGESVVIDGVAGATLKVKRG
jgi:membrane protein implicated in regulation of membrane protease activity